MQADSTTDLTGNDHVSIPFIGADAALDRITVLHGGLGGLLEWSGDGPAAPLLRLRIAVDDQPVPLTQLQWRRLDRWIPTFTTRTPDGSTITGTICAPGGYPAVRGFLIRIDVDHRGRAPCTLTLDLEVAWRWSRHWIATPRPLPGRNRLAADNTGEVLLLETDGGRGAALALAGSSAPTLYGPDHPLAPGDALEAENGGSLRARLSQRFTVRANSRGSAAVFAGVGRERDGALAAATGMRRAGADALLRQARLDLSHILRPAQDHRWAELLNRNLVFNRYFGVGRGIDDDRLYVLRSRSTGCPAPAVFNEREALFWTLPALLIADPGLAREAILRCMELYSERSGEYLRYLDGGALDSGLVLDQLLLYPWIVDRYMSITGDPSLADEPLVQHVLLDTDAAAFTRLHPEQLLGSTELLPSGEPADYPFATMTNVLLHAYCMALPKLPWPDAPEPPPRFHGAAAEMAAAVWQHCVTAVDGEPVLASSSSLDGDAAIYDDPALSLALLPFLGFCTDDDPIWRSTMEFLRSRRYPLWRDGAVPGLAGRADPERARLSALCADLLGPDSRATLDRLLRLRLPTGIAAAAYDPASGEASEPFDAAVAGFLAWTLGHAAEPTEAAAPKRQKRRR